MIGTLLWSLLSLQPVAPSPPERTAMIVELTAPARVVGLPRCCSDSDCTQSAEDEICFAELYQGSARVVRHLSGPPTERRVLLRLTAHARRWTSGQRFLVYGEPFTDQATNGWFASYWIQPDRRGRFCVGTNELARTEYAPLRPAFAQGRQVRVLNGSGEWTDGSQLTCLSASR